MYFVFLNASDGTFEPLQVDHPETLRSPHFIAIASNGGGLAELFTI